MKANKKIAYTAILVIAGAALVVDQIIGPGEAPAADDAPTGVAANAEPTSAPIARSDSDVRAHVAADLRAYAQRRPIIFDSVDDAFVLHASLQVKRAQPADASPDAVRVQDTPPDLVLSGTVVGGQARYAIINGRVVFQDKTIAGWRLVTVEAHYAVLEKGGRRIELAIPKPKIPDLIGHPE